MIQTPWQRRRTSSIFRTSPRSFDRPPSFPRASTRSEPSSTARNAVSFPNPCRDRVGDTYSRSNPARNPTSIRSLKRSAMKDTLIAQGYLPDAVEGDVRLFVMNGRPLEKDGSYAAFRRVPAKGDIRSNISAAGTAATVKVTPKILEVAEIVRPKLVADGMFLVGLDIVGDRILEINVFTPGGRSEPREAQRCGLLILGHRGRSKTRSRSARFRAPNCRMPFWRHCDRNMVCPRLLGRSRAAPTKWCLNRPARRSPAVPTHQQLDAGPQSYRQRLALPASRRPQQPIEWIVKSVH